MLGERVVNVNSQVQDLEGKCTSLQLTIDRLSNALAKTEEGESNLKDKVNKLYYTLKIFNIYCKVQKSHNAYNALNWLSVL